MVRVSLRTVTMQIPSQKIITKDNVSIDIAAVAYYRISNPENAVIVIENVYNAINQISQTTVRNVVGRFSLDQLLSDTAGINEQIKNVIDKHTEPWGTQVTAVEIKDIVLPDNMQRAMAKEAEAERERRAKIVAAEGEFQAAVKLGEAADIITAHPVALSASHAADNGGNFSRKELNHHLPRTIYDDGAGCYRADVKRFSVKITCSMVLSEFCHVPWRQIVPRNRLYLFGHYERSEVIQLSAGELDCFVAFLLAMTVGGDCHFYIDKCH